MTTQIEDVIAWAEREVQDLSPATVNHRYAVVALDALRFKQEAEKQPVAPDRAELIAYLHSMSAQFSPESTKRAMILKAIAALSSPPDRVSVPREPPDVTQDMLIAGWNASTIGVSPDDQRAAWKAMWNVWIAAGEQK